MHRSSGCSQQDKLIYVIVVDSEADLQDRLVEWKEIFGRYGLRVSLEKTEVFWVGQQKKSKTGWEETESPK